MAKVDPYLRPLFDALHDMLEPERVAQHLERGVIEVAPLAFMRGRTLNDSFIILDEAQNTSARADEDVPDAARLRLQDGRHRRHHADRPARASRTPGSVVVSDDPATTSRASVRALRRARTWCATSSCGGSSPPTTSTPSATAPELRRASAPERRALAPMLEVEVIGIEVARPPPARRRAVEIEELCALALSSAGIERGPRRRSSSSTRTGSASSTVSTARSDEPTDVLSFRVDERRATAPVRASSATS